METHQFWIKALRARQEVPTGSEGLRSQTEMDSAKAYWLPITMEEEAIQLRGCTGMSPRPSHSAGGLHKRHYQGFSTWVDSHPFCTVGTPSYCMCEHNNG